MNRNNEHEVELRSLIDRRRKGQEALVGLVDGLLDTYRELDADRYLSREQRELEKKRAKDEAGRRLRPLLDEARAAHEALREGARAQVERQAGSTNPSAENLLDRLLAQGLSYGPIIERAEKHGDRELLAAAYRGLRYLAVPDASGRVAFMDAPQLLNAARDGLARLAPGTERAALVEALGMSDDGAVEKAAKFAVRALTTGMAGGISRIEYAHATSGQKREHSSAGDQGTGGGEGGEGA